MAKSLKPKRTEQNIAVKFVRITVGLTRKKSQVEAERDEKDRRIIELYNRGLKDSDIARTLNISTTRVWTCRTKYNLPKNLTKLQSRIKELRQQGLCCSEIADSLNISTRNILTIAKKIGYPFTEEEKQKSQSIGYEKLKNTDEMAKHLIAERLTNFEYVGNYTGSDGTADIRCTVCGSIFTKSWVTIRHGKATCEVCVHNESVKRQKDRQRLKEQQRKEVAIKTEQEKNNRFWKHSFNQIEMQQCPVCRELFIPKRTKQYCCSFACSKVVANSHKKDKRIKRIKSVTDDRGITLEGLYKRDAGICYLCGKQCDYSDFSFTNNGQIIAGNNYPSIDHVVPLIKGGRHSWENIKLAHRLCNSVKSDSPLV